MKELPNQNYSMSYGVQAAEEKIENEQENTKLQDEKQINDTVAKVPVKKEENNTPDVTDEPKEYKYIEVDDDLESLIACVIEDGLWQNQPNDQFCEFLHYQLYEMHGKEVTMHGFVLKDNSLPENVIILARNIVSCCVPHSVASGFAVKVENADELEEGEWIVIAGVMDGVKMESYGVVIDFPIITDGIIIKRDTPPVDEQYVYP